MVDKACENGWIRIIICLIIVLYGVNTLVFVLLYEHDVHLNYEL